MNHDEATATMTEDDLAPELRALEGAAGTPATLSDGQPWLLADGGLCNALDEVRDSIDDQARLRGAVEMGDVRHAAFVLLRANYELTEREAAGLVLGAEEQPLADAVSAALFGPPDSRATYTAWAASALIANGIDPAKVPGHLRPYVLDQLVATGRAIPAGKFIDSAVAGGKMAAFRARAARATAEKAAATEAPE